MICTNCKKHSFVPIIVKNHKRKRCDTNHQQEQQETTEVSSSFIPFSSLFEFNLYHFYTQIPSTTSEEILRYHHEQAIQSILFNLSPSCIIST